MFSFQNLEHHPWRVGLVKVGRTRMNGINSIASSRERGLFLPGYRTSDHEAGHASHLRFDSSEAGKR